MLFGCQSGNQAASQTARLDAAPADKTLVAADTPSGPTGTSVGLSASASSAAASANVAASGHPGVSGEPVTDDSAPKAMTNAGSALTVDAPAQDCHVSVEQVIAWSSHGVPDETIIERINRSCTVFHLSAAEENHLRDMRVSDDVIHAMNDTERRIF